MRVIAFTVIAVAMFGVVRTQEDRNQMEKWENECRDKFSGAQETWVPEASPNTTKATKCFVACILEKKGVLKDGKIYLEPIMNEADETGRVINSSGHEKLDVKMWKLGIQKCARKSVGSTCDKGYTLWHCVYASFQKYFKYGDADTST